MKIFALRLFCGLTENALSFLVWRRKYKHPGLGFGILIVMGLALLQYPLRSRCFQEPQYEGVISAAPGLISLANRSISRIGKIGDQANLLIDKVESLVASTDSLANIQALSEKGIVKKILLISDLHSNPVGIELIKSLISAFNIDMVIDTGDLSDFGTALEAKTAEAISNLNLPYIFIPGNHETPEMVAFLAQLPNVTVLKGATTEIQGIKILTI